MNLNVDEFFKSPTPSIIHFTNIQLTQSDLPLILNALHTHSNILFINWTAQNESILNATSPTLKSSIQKQLVLNLLLHSRNSTNELLVELSEFVEFLDESFLKHLAHALKNNRFVAHVDFGSGGGVGDEILTDAAHLLKTSKYFRRIEYYVTRNNANFARFPSDYVHCLLSRHCRDDDEQEDTTSISLGLERMGWKKVTSDLMTAAEFKMKGYVSILYVNEARRQLVLAFKGMKLGNN